MAPGTGVWVGVKVGTWVGVEVGLTVHVGVGVGGTGVAVDVGVWVGMEVGEGVLVGVKVAVGVWVAVAVAVAVTVAVWVGVGDGATSDTTGVMFITMTSVIVAMRHNTNKLNIPVIIFSKVFIFFSYRNLHINDCYHCHCVIGPYCP